MFIPHYVSCVLCHLSLGMCHMSPVTCCMSCFIYIKKNCPSKELDNMVELVGGGCVINGPTPYSFKGLPPRRILYCKIPLVFHNGPTSNHRVDLILGWDQLQSEASRFTALPEAALYTTTFSRDFQGLEGRISCL